MAELEAVTKVTVPPASHTSPQQADGRRVSMLKMIYSLPWFGVNLHEVSQVEGLVSSLFDWRDHRKWRCGLSFCLVEHLVALLHFLVP